MSTTMSGAFSKHKPECGPDARGYFGDFGGRFVPEVLVEPLRELEAALRLALADTAFWNESRKAHGQA